MNEKEELLRELKEKFDESKKEIGFKPSFEELEESFSITDSVLSIGFVSDNFSRQLCSRIVDYFRDWHGYLNNLLIPSSSYYASQTESKLFQLEDDKKKIWELIKVSMKFSSMHSFIGVRKNKSLEKEFIDGAYESWNNFFKGELSEILEKVYLNWKE